MLCEFRCVCRFFPGLQKIRFCFVPPVLFFSSLFVVCFMLASDWVNWLVLQREEKKTTNFNQSTPIEIQQTICFTYFKSKNATSKMNKWSFFSIPIENFLQINWCQRWELRNFWQRDEIMLSRFGRSNLIFRFAYWWPFDFPISICAANNDFSNFSFQFKNMNSLHSFYLRLHKHSRPSFVWGSIYLFKRKREKIKKIFHKKLMLNAWISHSLNCTRIWNQFFLLTLS